MPQMNSTYFFNCAGIKLILLVAYASVNIGKLIEEQEEDVEFSLDFKQRIQIDDIKKKKIIEPISGDLTVKISVRLKVRTLRYY